MDDSSKTPLTRRLARYGNRFTVALLLSLLLHLLTLIKFTRSERYASAAEKGPKDGSPIEVTVQDAPLQPALPPPPPPPPPKPPEPPPPPPVKKVVRKPPPPPKVEPPDPGPEPDLNEELAAKLEDDAPRREPELNPDREAEPDRPSSVRAQAGRLAGAAQCKDPIEGRWEAFPYLPNNGWYHFTLTIYREGDILFGDTRAVYWDGDETESQMPPCTFGRNEGVVEMLSRGMVHGLEVRFSAQEIARKHISCGQYFYYALDTFSGTIDPNTQEFMSVDNDGAAAKDEPTLFRRTGCLPGE